MGLRDDFLRDNPVEQTLQGLGVALIGSGKNRKAKCPFHEDRNPSFSISVDTGAWKCFSGCGEGGLIDFVARKRGITAEAIIEEYKQKKRSPNQEFKPQAAPPPPIDWNSCVEEFGPLEVAELCEQRGYSQSFVEQLVERKMIGVCEGRISFPIYAAGRVIGTHQKVSGGKWIIRGGSGSPWVIGDHHENVMVFESQWDAFAVMDKMRWFELNMGAICSIVITRGASKGKAIQNLFPITGKIVVWMQNDPKDEEGNSPAETWLLDILSVVKKANVCRPPKQFKDINDWTRAGATAGEIATLAETGELVRDPRLPVIRPPLDLSLAMKFNPKEDPDCLIGNRYLCRGGSSLWVGGSGIGKSVITIQAAIMFALREPLFGLEPKRPLKSIIVSAEDDFGDISETIQGVARGLGISEDSPKFKVIMENVLVFQESTLKGLAFIGWCEELVLEHNADLLWINPLLSFYAGNPSDPEKASEFTGALSAMQFNTKVCSMLVHHTGKPKESKTTEAFSIEDFSYIGLGSSVWTNWARAILVLQSMKQPKNTFVLRLAKRGQRSGVVDENFDKIREIYLRHSQNGLAWELSEFCPNDDENGTGGRPLKISWSKVNEAWDGMDKTHQELKDILVGVLSISDKTAFRAIAKWSGVHIKKNTKDLWVKIEP